MQDSLPPEASSKPAACPPKTSVACPPPTPTMPGKGSDVRHVSQMLVGGTCLLLSACGASATTPTPSRASQSPGASASAANGACSSVHTTTPIDKVPVACAALWEPYRVTMVPPSDILQQEHVPAAPRVVNMTSGAVSQADAQHWANASNRGSGWYKWAEAFDQPYLLPHLVGPALIGPTQEKALEQGARISLPDCAIYPLTNALYPVLADGKAYFASKHLPTDDTYVLVVTYSGPCAATATYPDGHTQSIPETSGPVTAFEPGVLRPDAVLGDTWYTDAGGSCSDPAGPPPEWCGR